MATLKEQNKHQNEKTPLQTNTKKNKSNIISIVMKAGAPSLNPMYLYKILPQKLSILKQFETLPVLCQYILHFYGRRPARPGLDRYMYLSSHSVCNEKIASSNPTYTTVFNILVRLLKTMNHRQDLVQNTRFKSD